MHHLAIAGFLSALAVAHATVAAYCAFLFIRSSMSASPERPNRKRGRTERELAAFALLNVFVTALDAGLARATSLNLPSGAVIAERELSVALMAAEAGRIGAIVLLLHFMLEYLRVNRPRWVLPAIYASGGLFEVGNALGRLNRYDELRSRAVFTFGAAVPDVRAPATLAGLLFSIAVVLAVFSALALLGRTFLGGRREAMSFIGMTLLCVTALHDALRNTGSITGPVLGPLGFAAFVNGVMLTLLSRYTSLRGQLEERSRELRARARTIARSYEELRAAQDDMVRKEQLAAVGELSAVVAHEVRNPLAIISNAVATLRREGIPSEDRETLLVILDEESSRLNRLVGDLLRYARPVNIERQQVSLRELVERGLSLAEGRTDLTVELVEPTPVEKVSGDPNLLRQVIENLINNAIQAMSGGGGTLTITLVNIERESVRGVELQIQDTGEGMDTMVRSRALDPFFTTRPSGTGLGLAIVARIVDAHGGVLRIKSAAGAGTVMHVFLPLSGEAPPRRSTSDRPDERASDTPMPDELRKAIGSGKPKR